MKHIQSISLLIFCLSLSACQAQTQQQPEQLLGRWVLDMSPQDTTDSNFALMIITSVSNNKIEGTFYRDSVAISNGNLNTTTDRIYGALVSGDNSGQYNTSFYLFQEKLYGSTHSIGKDFLSVWVATKKQ